LLRHVPGRWIGHAVLSNTFRHPAVLAKAATVLDHATGGGFIVGLGAGCHEGEHVSLGIPLPPMRERFDRFESAVHVLRALWSPEASAPPGGAPPAPFHPLAALPRPDPSSPLVEPTNDPPPTASGPRLWLGAGKRRGIALTAALADGWGMPAVDILSGRANHPDDFHHGRDATL